MIFDGQTSCCHIDGIAVLMDFAQRLHFDVHLSPSGEVSGLGLIFLIAAGHIVRRVGKLDGIWNACIPFPVQHLVREDGDAKLITIGDVIGPEDHGVKIDLVAVGDRAAVQQIRHLRSDVGDVHAVFGVIYTVVLIFNPALENVSRLQRYAGIVYVGIHLTGVKLVLRQTHGGDQRRAVSLIEIDVQTRIRINALNNDVNRKLICFKQRISSSDSRIFHQGPLTVAVNVHNAAGFSGGINPLVRRADQHPHRFAVGRLDFFSIIFEGDVHRGNILGLDGVILHGVLYGIDDGLCIDCPDDHCRSLGEDILIRPDGNADAAYLVEERHGRHVYGRLRLFLGGLIISLFRGFLSPLGRLLRGDLLGNTRRLLCGFFRRCLSRSLRRLFRRDLRKFHLGLSRRLRLGCLGLFRIHGLDLCRLLCRFFLWSLSRRLFRGDLRELYFGFFRSVSFLQCRLIRNLDLHRHSDGRQSRAEEQHQSQEHAEKSLKGRPGPTVPRTLHVCFLLFPADTMRSC